jgi:hypothetical protein
VVRRNIHSKGRRIGLNGGAVRAHDSIRCESTVSDDIINDAPDIKSSAPHTANSSKMDEIPKPLTSIQVLRLTPLRLSPLSTSPHTTSPCSSLTPLRLALVSHGDRGVALKGLYLLIICFGFCIRSIAHGGVDISWYTLL